MPLHRLGRHGKESSKNNKCFGNWRATDLETYQNKDWGIKAKERALSTMRYLDGDLAKHKFLAGDTFSVADITAFAGLGFADFSKIDIPAELKNLIAWRARVAACPSIAHA